MVIKINKFKVICDKCSKEEFIETPNNIPSLPPGWMDINIEIRKNRGYIQVCPDCYRGAPSLS